MPNFSKDLQDKEVTIFMICTLTGEKTEGRVQDCGAEGMNWRSGEKTIYTKNRKWSGGKV